MTTKKLLGSGSSRRDESLEARIDQKTDDVLRSRHIDLRGIRSE